MSKTTISPKIALPLWVKAGGRCQYPGCNEALWRDDLTLAKLNRAHIAHIISDSPDGPRGDAELSPKFESDISNLMLMCSTHHRLIDHEEVEAHPVELLSLYKKDHEERIERMTSIHSNMRTEIFIFSSRIANRQANISYEDARKVIAAKRYPASDKAIEINLTPINLDERDPQFWELVKIQIDREAERYFGDNKGPSGKPINHLSVFALAPIPALIYLGKKIGDIVSADVYQRHRQPAGWQWGILQDDNFDYLLNRYLADNTDADTPVVINLSLSNPIRNEDIESYFGRSAHIYEMAIPNPTRDFLQAEEQLELFRRRWYRLISQLLSDQGTNGMIHLFAAVPNAIAVEIGRSLMKVDRPMTIYEKRDGYFCEGMVI
jgi:hypothetical protein